MTIFLFILVRWNGRGATEDGDHRAGRSPLLHGSPVPSRIPVQTTQTIAALSGPHSGGNRKTPTLLVQGKIRQAERGHGSCDRG